MPYENEYSCRLKDPDGFKDPWARVKRKSKSMGKTYIAVRGTSKATDKFEDQSYRYPKKTWTSTDARKHCKAHKGSSEAAGEIQRIDALVEASESNATSLENETALLTRFATRIVNTPLMITQDKLNVILSVIGSRIGLAVDDSGIELEAASRSKREMVNRRPGEQCIAVVEVYDTLVYRSRGISSLSGLSTYEQIGKDFEEALEDPEVDGILLDIDSPGGEVSGVFELVDKIYEARGTKPIVAAVNDRAYSAAYAIASAADKMYVPRMGGTGSIGVIAVHTDQSKLNAKIGVKYTSIFAGAKKDDLSPHQEISAEAVRDVQLKVDEAYNLFVDTVARNRDISSEMVRGTEAATYQGKDGIQAGLVDGVLSWDGVLETFSTTGGGSSMPNKSKEEQLDAIFKDVSPEVRGELYSQMGVVSVETIKTLKTDTKALQDELKDLKKRDEGELKTIREEIEKEVHKKSGTEKLQAEIARLQKEMSAANKDIADAKKETLTEKERGRKMELTNEVKAIGLPGDNAKRVEMIFALEKTQPDMAKDYIAQMKSDASLVKEAGLLKEFGRLGEGNVESAGAQLEAEVKKLVDGGMDEVTARRKVGTDNPDLYKRYKAERGEG